MRFCLITFRSVTPAQKGESVLHRMGIECAIQRTPRWMAEQGCGYSLRLHQRDVAQAVQRLRETDTHFRKVYCQREKGNYEELEL